MRAGDAVQIVRAAIGTETDRASQSARGDPHGDGEPARASDEMKAQWRRRRSHREGARDPEERAGAPRRRAGGAAVRPNRAAELHGMMPARASPRGRGLSLQKQAAQRSCARRCRERSTRSSHAGRHPVTRLMEGESEKLLRLDAICTSAHRPTRRCQVADAVLARGGHQDPTARGRALPGPRASGRRAREVARGDDLRLRGEPRPHHMRGMEKHAVSRLTAAAGVRGYERAVSSREVRRSLLGRAVRRNEKAHPDVLNVLLKILGRRA